MVLNILNYENLFTSPPQPSLIEHGLKRTDYHDAFAVRVTPEDAPPLEKLPLLFFHSFPAWFRGLLGLRELIAGWIGLKTAKGFNIEQELATFSAQPGESIALFKVLKTNQEEIMMGENDSHLDFRLSFIAKPKEEQTIEICLATTVMFNNWVGRLYFLPVGPIHRLIVPIILRRMIKRWHQGLV